MALFAHLHVNHQAKPEMQHLTIGQKQRLDAA